MFSLRRERRGEKGGARIAARSHHSQIRRFRTFSPLQFFSRSSLIISPFFLVSPQNGSSPYLVFLSPSFFSHFLFFSFSVHLKLSSRAGFYPIRSVVSSAVTPHFTDRHFVPWRTVNNKNAPFFSFFLLFSKLEHFLTPWSLSDLIMFFRFVRLACSVT